MGFCSAKPTQSKGLGENFTQMGFSGEWWEEAARESLQTQREASASEELFGLLPLPGRAALGPRRHPCAPWSPRGLPKHCPFSEQERGWPQRERRKGKGRGDEEGGQHEKRCSKAEIRRGE